MTKSNMTEQQATERAMVAMVTNNGLSLKYVLVQTEAICLAAVNEHNWALADVNEQFQEACKSFLNTKGYNC
jgi:hypothetical protein